jgi:hypothetical protein
MQPEFGGSIQSAWERPKYALYWSIKLAGSILKCAAAIDIGDRGEHPKQQE